MNVFFTVCTINYLSKANTLIKSIKKTNPNTEIVLCIGDKKPTDVNIDIDGCTIVYVEELQIPMFSDMCDRYTIMELLCALKPQFFLYLLRKFSKSEFFFYFDPDVMIFNDIKIIENEMLDYDVILTPHMLKPILDDKLPSELHCKRTGLYNMGFCGIRNNENAKKIIEWWANKLVTQGYLIMEKGLYADQLWMDLVPIFFDRVLVSKNPGLNMAHWNLHERKFDKIGDSYIVNNNYPLVFFHFSHYHSNNEGILAEFHTRFNLETRPELKEIFEIYDKELNENYTEYNNIPCFYVKNEKNKQKKRRRDLIASVVLPPSIKTLLMKIIKK